MKNKLSIEFLKKDHLHTTARTKNHSATTVPFATSIKSAYYLKKHPYQHVEPQFTEKSCFIQNKAK